MNTEGSVGQISTRDVTVENVLAAFMNKPEMATQELYQQLALDLELEPTYVSKKVPVGKEGSSHNLFHRKARWAIQSLKHLGVLERMERGRWALTKTAKQELTPAPPKQVLVAFNSNLGVALWANCEDVFAGLQDEITLSFTSPPYPLARERLYGNVSEDLYVDWLCEMTEPIVKNLRKGGHVVLNLSNDIFDRGSPSRSIYLEMTVVAFQKRLSLYLMERFVWVNPCKAPGPIQWASLQRVQVNTGYEPVLWFTNDPAAVRANNQRVLLPHTEQHLKLMLRGGEKRNEIYSGGAYRVKEGSFSNLTEGRIPRNVLVIPHMDPDQRPAREFAKLHGIPQHPAPMPTKLSDFFVDFLTEEGDLVVDQFAGYGTTARSAERKNRRWLITERCREYIAAAAERFRQCQGFEAAEA
jgi:DNA modification methylase